jgi:hypothetical protein
LGTLGKTIRPTSAPRKGGSEIQVSNLNFEDERSLYFTGVIAVTGLSDLFGSFVERIGKDATKRVDV